MDGGRRTENGNVQPLVTIRSAQRGDAPAIAEVLVATWRAACRGLLPQNHLTRLSHERTERFWTAMLSHPPSERNRTFVAEVDRRVVGVVATGPSDDKGADSESTAAVYAIYLLPDFRGRGIGRTLLSAATKEMRAVGFRAATLWVLESNIRTRRFYEAAGWRLDEAAREGEYGESRAREVRYRIDFD